MEKTILKMGWDVERPSAMVFLCRVMSLIAKAPSKPKPDYAVIFESDQFRAIYKQTRTGTHVYQITTINR